MQPSLRVCKVWTFFLKRVHIFINQEYVKKVRRLMPTVNQKPLQTCIVNLGLLIRCYIKTRVILTCF